jgi:hypothetical protein
MLSDSNDYGYKQMVKMEINGCRLMKAGYLKQARSGIKVLLWFGSVVVALHILAKGMKGRSYRVVAQ